MKLNHPGIYRIIGEDFELLANVVGEAPMLRIPNALVMNDLIQKGLFHVVTEESYEIQAVLTEPDKFIFFEYEYSEVCDLPSRRKSTRGVKIPDITDEQFEDFTQRYIEDARTPGKGIWATKMYIVSKTEWSIPQAHVIVLQIINKLRKHGRIQFN